MKHLVDPVIRTASDLTEAAKRVVDDGVSFFQGSLGKIPLFSSIVAHESEEASERDEMHYFLVPYRLSESSYALYTQRVLPKGVGPENALPKARLFHLPTEGTLQVMEDLLGKQLVDEQLQQSDDDAPIANRLDRIADEIDKQSNIVTGGLIIIGGAVAIANPLLGVGIAAKALLPTLGSKLSKHGMNHVSDWLRERKRQTNYQEAEDAAQKEIKRLKPEVQINATLAILETALATPDTDHDPSLVFAGMMNTPAEALETQFTAAAITTIYESCLDNKKTHAEACLHPTDISWLKSLGDL